MCGRLHRRPGESGSARCRDHLHRPERTDPELKTEQGNGIWLCGGGNLAYRLLPEIDELVLKLYPIVIGSGVPLFAGEFRPEHFTLAERIVYDNGVALLSYTK
jgi:dihydrofolate reductase